MAKRFNLTPRETQVAAGISKALPLASIADDLAISRHTANFHMRGIYRKMAVHCQAEFFLKAYLLD